VEVLVAHATRVPRASVHLLAAVIEPPPNLVVPPDRFDGLRRGEYDQARARYLDVSSIDRECAVRLLVDAVPEPLRVQVSPDQLPAVRDADDQGPSAWRIGHADRFSSEVLRRGLTMCAAGTEVPCLVAAAGLFLQV